MIGIVQIVTPFGSGSLLHEILKSFALSQDRGIESWVSLGFNVDQGAKRIFRGTILFSGTFLQVSDVDEFSISPGTSLNRTSVHMGLSPLIVAVVAHLHPGWAQGSSIGIQTDGIQADR
jgi:hypothetical protein